MFDPTFGGINFVIRWLLRPFTRADHALQDWYRARGTEAWPIATAHINNSCRAVKVKRGVWRVTIVYTFQSDAELWTGETWRQFAVKTDATRYAGKHPPGSAVVVRYQPGNPEKSVALARDQHAASPDGTI